MLKYGSDKPDLRNPLIIVDVSEEFGSNDVSFKAFKGKTVRAIPHRARRLNRGVFR